MEKQLAIIAYLLARAIGQKENITTEDVLADAIKYVCPQEEKPKRTRTSKPVTKESIDRVYALYPTKCPMTGRSLGKSYKDKEKIAILLRTTSEEKLSDTIQRYIKENTESKSYFKNFSTFLNNLPDYDDVPLPMAQEEKEESVLIDPEMAEWVRERGKLYKNQ